MPRENTNPWADATNQAVGALYKYYLSQPTAADQIKMELQQAQLADLQRQQGMGNYTLQNLSPEIRNDLYRRQLQERGDISGAQLFGTYVNKPMQLDAGDTKYIVDGSTGLPMQQYGVGVAPSTVVDKEGGRIITTPAVPSQTRPPMPSAGGSPMADLFGAVVNRESGGDPNALSSAGAAGIAQIMPDTARDPGYGVKPLPGWDGNDPRTAPVDEQLRFGQDYLGAMINNRGGNVAEGLAAYNAGPGAVDRHSGIPPYAETQNYVQNIMGDTNNRFASGVRQPSGITVQPLAPPAQQGTPQTGQPAVQPQQQGQQTVRQPDGTIITSLPKSPTQVDKETKTSTMRSIQGDIVNDDINRALSALDSSIPVTGMVGSMTKGIPGSPAHDLGELLTTIQANIGFDKLQAMREASPTGGALGQVSDFENRQLQAIYGSLAQSQSEPQLRYNMMRLYNTYNDIVHGQGNGNRFDIPTVEKVTQMQTPEELQKAMEFFNYDPPDDIENAIVQQANRLGL